MERRNLEVPRSHGGEAVARILHDGLGVPHSTAKGLIDAGCVTINGRPVRAHSQRCAGGDVVEVKFDPSRQYHPLPEPRHGRGFRVAHEDKEIVVVDKMPGVLSSPAPGEEDSLAERIADSLRSRGFRKPQLFVIHRLDRHTSGLLVFAKSQRALESIATQFESREAGRNYVAVVEGRVEKDRGTITSWLTEDPKSLSVRTTSLRGAGKRAITHFEVLERFDSATLVRVRLETGRKHQIRVHFAEIGHPTLGDRRYAQASTLIERVALHAESLTFRHPRTLERVTYESPWPEDFERLVRTLRQRSTSTLQGRDRDAMPATMSPNDNEAAGLRAAPGTRRHGPGYGAVRFPEGLIVTEWSGTEAGAGERAKATRQDFRAQSPRRVDNKSLRSATAAPQHGPTSGDRRGPQTLGTGERKGAPSSKPTGPGATPAATIGREAPRANPRLARQRAVGFKPPYDRDRRSRPIGSQGTLPERGAGSQSTAPRAFRSKSVGGFAPEGERGECAFGPTRGQGDENSGGRGGGAKRQGGFRPSPEGFRSKREGGFSRGGDQRPRPKAAGETGQRREGDFRSKHDGGFKPQGDRFRSRRQGQAESKGESKSETDVASRKERAFSEGGDVGPRDGRFKPVGARGRPGSGPRFRPKSEGGFSTEGSESRSRRKGESGETAGRQRNQTDGGERETISPDRHEAGGGGGRLGRGGPKGDEGARPRKPWEFRQKGMTLRRARRSKIAAARGKRKKDQDR